MLATAIHLLQGTPYIYQGEEIGMTNPYFNDIREYRDVESLNAYRLLKGQGKPEAEIMEILMQKSRDNARTPMQWDDSVNAGFTTGTPWINVAFNYRKINVKRALADQDSIFHHYKRLIQLRKQYDVIAYGDFRLILEEHPQIFAYLRTYEGDTLLVVNNFYGNEAAFKLPADIILPATSRLLLSNYKDTKHQIDSLTLRPYESAVFLLTNEEVQP